MLCLRTPQKVNHNTYTLPIIYYSHIVHEQSPLTMSPTQRHAHSHLQSLKGMETPGKSSSKNKTSPPTVISALRTSLANE